MKLLFFIASKSLLPFFLFGCCVSIAHSQPWSRQQTFGVEGPIDHSTVMPAAALQSLKVAKQSADILRECARQEGIQVSEIPASWFTASEVELSQSHSSGMVVRGDNKCLLGAHITQFWLLAKSGTAYACVFSGRADALKLLPRRTNGYRDVQLVFIMEAGAEVQYVTFRYGNGAYHLSGRRTERVNRP